MLVECATWEGGASGSTEPNCRSFKQSDPGIVDDPVEDDLALLKNGDDDAWKAVLNDFGAGFCRLRRRVWGEEPAASLEAVQDALALSFEKLRSGSFDKSGVRHLRNYIYTLLKLRRHVTRNSRPLPVDHLVDPNSFATTGDAPDSLHSHIDLPSLKRIISERLNDGEQQVINLAFLSDPPASNVQIASELKIAYGTVCSRKQSGLRKLRPHL